MHFIGTAMHVSVEEPLFAQESKKHVNHACLMVYLSLSRAVHTPLLLVQTPLWPTYFNNIIFMDHTVVKILELLDRKYMYIMKDGVERNFSVPGLCCLNGE